MYKGLTILKDLGWLRVSVETDSLVVVNLLREPEDLTHPNHDMIEDCKSLVKKMQAEVKHVMRDENKAADRLAKIGANQLEDLVLLDEYPRVLDAPLVADIHGMIDRNLSMSETDELRSQPDDFGGPCDDPPVMHRVQSPLPLHLAVLEEQLEFQHRDIQRIPAENSHLVDENVILDRELTEVIDEIQRLDQVIPNLHAEKDSKARELIDRGLKLEGELGCAEPLRAEVIELRSEAEKLNFLQEELSALVQTLTKDIVREQAENEQVVALKTEIDGMRKDLMEIRRDFEIKRNANEEQLILKESMEKSLASMACEIDNLRAELLSAERERARCWRDGMFSGSPEIRYPDDSAYGDFSGAGTWTVYDHRGPRYY